MDMTEKEIQQHVKRRMKEAVSYVEKQWGHGWPRLGENLQQALIRAEILNEISRISAVDTDSIRYRALVDALAVAAVQWNDTK